MKYINFIILFLVFLLTGCASNNNVSYKKDEKIEFGSKTTVNPKIVLESAYEGFYVSEKLEQKLNKIEFSSTTYLKGNENCIGLVRLTVSGSIDYYKLINTLKKRAYDMGGNAIGVFDYKESRKVIVNQHRYKVFEKNQTIFDKPKIKYVLIKENRKIAKITADIFRCNRKST